MCVCASACKFYAFTYMCHKYIMFLNTNIKFCEKASNISGKPYLYGILLKNIIYNLSNKANIRAKKENL